LEQDFGEIGDYDTENSARWIFRKACLEHDIAGNLWHFWSRLEENSDNIGAEDEIYSARWIYSTYINKNGKFAPVYRAYATMEIKHNRVNLARRILRQITQVNDYCLPNLTILEILLGNINNNDLCCAYQLMKRMELAVRESSSAGALLGLYSCNKLLGNTEEAERYYELFVASDSKKEDAQIATDEFIDICRVAISNPID
jgi:hypothetical protein